MFNLKKHPYHLLLLITTAVSIAWLFASGQTLDLQLPGTYLVILIKQLFEGIIILLLLFWLLYLLTKQFLFSRVLMWIHLIITIGSSITLVWLSFYSDRYYSGYAGMPRRYYDYGTWNTFLSDDILTTSVLSAVLFMALGTAIYFINIIIGLIKNAAQRNSK